MWQLILMRGYADLSGRLLPKIVRCWLALVGG